MDADAWCGCRFQLSPGAFTCAAAAAADRAIQATSSCLSPIRFSFFLDLLLAVDPNVISPPQLKLRGRINLLC